MYRIIATFFLSAFLPAILWAQGATSAETPAQIDPSVVDGADKYLKAVLSGNASVIYLALQNLEHLQISAFYTLLVAICFFGFVFFSAQRSVFRQSPLFVSRAPPQPVS